MFHATSSHALEPVNSFPSFPSGPSADIVVITSTRAVIGDRLTPATIAISTTTGKIVWIEDSLWPESSFPPGTQYTNYSPHILLPGLVDAHVHLNEPGRREWEGFWTGTRAAASGGVTTVIDMPLNSIPPTTTVAGLNAKLSAAEGQCWVDVGFYGGLIPGNVEELKPLIRAGVRGFKAFLIDSGVDEFPSVSPADVANALRELADEQTTVMFHAEMVSPSSTGTGDEMALGPPEEYQTFLESRPPSLETFAIQEIIKLAYLAPRLPLHIVHLSAAEAIPLIRNARRDHVKITAETCFHYLSLAAENIPAGDTRHKCCPPVRSQSNQDRLWEELLNPKGVLKTVVSDHSPCTPNLKLLPAHLLNDQSNKKAESGSEKSLGDFMAAWGGISSVGLGLSILWTELSRRKLDEDSILPDLVRWCCSNTARQVGLQHQKGSLKVNMDGDICVFDDKGMFMVEPDNMHFRNKCSPYQGRVLTGLVKATWLRGQRIYTSEGGFGHETRPSGQLLLDQRIY